MYMSITSDIDILWQMYSADTLWQSYWQSYGKCIAADI